MFKELEVLVNGANLEKLLQDYALAIKTLEEAGYTRKEGVARWKPPLGKSVKHWFDVIDELREENKKLEKEALIWRFIRSNSTSLETEGAADELTKLNITFYKHILPHDKMTNATQIVEDQLYYLANELLEEKANG